MSAIVDVPKAVNGFINPVESPLKPLRPRALREIVFEMLLQAIVTGEMKTGDWLNHQQLAKRFEVSPTPVREALQQLALLGIVENQHNRGTVVRPFGPTQLKEIFYVRALLETEATRLSCERIATSDLEQLKEKTVQLLTNEFPNWVVSEAPKVDKKLHDLLAENCGNQRLKEEIERYHVFIFIPQTIPVSAHQLVLTEHLQIIEALLQRQSEAAAKAVREHICNGAVLCNSMLFKT